MATKEPWLTTKQAAEYTGYSVPTISRFCRLGLLRHRRVGTRSQYRFKTAWLDSLLAHEEGGVMTPPIPKERLLSISSFQDEPDEFAAMIAAAQRRIG